MSLEPKEPQDVANEYLRKHHITELFEVLSLSIALLTNSFRIFALPFALNNPKMLNNLSLNNSSLRKAKVIGISFGNKLTE